MGRKKNKSPRPKTVRKKAAGKKTTLREHPSATPPQSASKADEVLTKARQLYFRKDFDKAIPLLLRLDETEDFKDDVGIRERCRLLAFSYANSGQFATAEEWARKGLELDGRDRDFHFALAYVMAHYKDYRRCLEHARDFIMLNEADNRTKEKIEYLSDGHLHLLYNYLGLAYQAENEYGRAEEAFLKAIGLNKAYSHPYLNLAALYQRRRAFEKAEKIIDRGLKACSQVQELMILKRSLANKATVSACMIVKNEEEFLPNCLESIRNWVDEIIIVDTGSTDRTVEIAQSYGAKVYFQEWSKDFSKHRNFSLSKATCDWILVIDADEEFIQDDLPALRQAVNQENCRLISINVFNSDRATRECTSFLPSIRLFRKDAGFHYEGIVHNQLKFEESEPILRIGVRIRHYGYNLPMEQKMEKVARSRELLEKQLAETPGDPFVHFNYAQLLRGITGKPDDDLCGLIIEHAEKAVELADPDNVAMLPIHLQGLHQQATTYIQQGKFEKAEYACRQALDIKPDYLDAIYSLAEACGRMRRFEEAEKYFNEYLKLQRLYDPSEEQLNIILIFGFARHRAYYSLGILRQLQNDLAGAEEYFLRVLEEIELYQDTFLRLAHIYLERKDPEKAITFIEEELASNPNSDLANLYKARYFSLKMDDVESEKYLNKAVEFTKGRPAVYEAAATYWIEKGLPQNALPLLRKLTQLKPEYHSGLKLLARAYFETSEFSDARESYEEYLRVRPDDAETLNDLANCHFKLGDYETADRVYTEALEINNQLGASYRNLGLTKLRLGKLDEALILLESYAELAPEDLEINLAIGNIYRQSGRHAEAIPHYEKFLRDDPDNAEGLFNISECYYQLGYIESAAIGYRQILKLNPDFQPAANRLNEIETSKATV
ncbi:MAG: tetratricopeptide repeat protein [Candidatus Zixiibacteriota bacterium]|nr:MAG: tetratricopeptide repeat protein [candidate division Zixibacteria bacterium]